ncbi:hypothetical protein BM221_006509 [Beauveria bassiana]|uniref:Uncharacterized protein n=1 Tax=Beauveria bassiana TaxID=176275 RepID=A0A2N6NHV1_BEABA|nr:hypothetical protein BM221_006509 [Beauveria bassiana]
MDMMPSIQLGDPATNAAILSGPISGGASIEDTSELAQLHRAKGQESRLDQLLSASVSAEPLTYATGGDNIFSAPCFMAEQVNSIC